mmetsp:Transcript_75289/g.156849  ORF Transcript_75289/g.156849 Transcript_75289/m.156849 type:complete len:194 (-) Transcript_75289:183-764(-)|eukprot:CAMPEP_0206487570 /NCGR_PEP_ID=MMETSP0324_2-20121206/41734_1 /ASSEMBLY_ACC=CAM_ASM_000836 /TAXON_ID=2866 /ORGANISM="Crypthecodinium cohnii, Strain Seligo" /LENGTH=193 /DNA_ID=CAMNT_0053966105 /DNA_START=114 /DNA_END=695 /DNA_ORIENTATION=-
MGQTTSKRTALVVGWNGVGKTAVVQCLRGASSEPLPTRGVHRDIARLKCGPPGDERECDLELIDLGIEPKLESKTSQYEQFLDTDAIIFVLEANKTLERFRPDEMEKSKELMKRICAEPEVSGKVFLVLANKCEREDALSIKEITEYFDLENTFHGKTWHLEHCSTVSGKGLRAAATWLVIKLDDLERKKAEG